MPNPKYVTGVGKPHIRVTDIHIRAVAPDPTQADPLVATISYTEAESVLMADGSVREFRLLPPRSFQVRASELAQPRAIVNADTDVDIGQTTVMMIQAHILAGVRHDQRQRDLAEQPPAPQPE